jgi:hypothetical protein
MSGAKSSPLRRNRTKTSIPLTWGGFFVSAYAIKNPSARGRIGRGENLKKDGLQKTRRAKKYK